MDKKLRPFGPKFFGTIARGEFELEICSVQLRSVALRVWVNDLYVRTTIAVPDIIYEVRHVYKRGLQPHKATILDLVAVVPKDVTEIAVRRCVAFQAAYSINRHFGKFPHPGLHDTGTLEDVAYQYRKACPWWRWLW